MAKKKTLPGKNKPTRPNEDTLRRERETVTMFVELRRLRERHEYPTDKLKRMLLAANDKRWAILFERERKFRHYKNPVAAWDAYAFARRENLPIPPFVYDYLDASAKRLLTMPEEKTGDHLVKVFGFGGRAQGTVFTRHQSTVKGHRFAHMVLHERKKDDEKRWKALREEGKKLKRKTNEQIFKDVALKMGVHPETVKKAHSELKEVVRRRGTLP
jgi:hypothetical protein